MSASSFGSRFVIHTFGESHGPAMGVVIDGCPAGIEIDQKIIQQKLDRRRPGQSEMVSSRQEKDQVEILSGVFQGKSLGTPMAMLVRNQDQKSEDYTEIAQKPRAGHADDIWKNKFKHSDPRGGGRSSGRETVSRVMGGAVAQMLIQSQSESTKIFAFAHQIGPWQLTPEESSVVKPELIDSTPTRFPSDRSIEVESFLKEAQSQGESYGGVAEIRIQNPLPNLGQPVFHKLKSDLAQAFMSIGAVTGIELGLGFDSIEMAGTAFHSRPQSKNYGGIRGGVSTGEEIIMRVIFKPTSSILDVAKKGRHDPCIVIRAIPVLEAMAALVIADHILWQRTDLK